MQDGRGRVPIPAGLVAYSQPYGGNLEPWETTVKLFVSDGQQTVTVPPGLVGETFLQAQKQLGAENLYAPEDFVPVNNPSQDGYVINSDPKSGQPIREGSAVTLYVGEYTGPTTTKPVKPTSTTAGSFTSTTAVSATTTGATSVTTSVTTSPTTVPTRPRMGCCHACQGLTAIARRRGPADLLTGPPCGILTGTAAWASLYANPLRGSR